jgi:hypothetical protein
MAAITTRRESTRYNVQDPIYLRNFPWAVQHSVGFRDWDEFVRYLLENLPFSSTTTRQRAVGEIHKIFDGSIADALVVRIWKAYEDEHLLTDVIRTKWLSAVPEALGRFCTEWLPKFEVGRPVTDADRSEFLAAEPGLYDPRRRLLRVYATLGFLRKDGKHFVVSHQSLPKTAFILCLFDRFAQQPGTVSVRRILDDAFWRYLGGRHESDVRRSIDDAELAGLVRHEQVDQLDQITTRASLSDLLQRRVRL